MKIIFFITVIIASIAILGAFIFYPKNKKTEIFSPVLNSETELELKSSTTSAKVGQPFKLSIFLRSGRRDIASFDAVVTYDSTMVRVDEIKTSDVFPENPRKLIEADKNRFIISGLQTDLIQDFLIKNKEFAEVTATPLRVGPINFEFMLDGRKFTNLTSFKGEEIEFKIKNISL